METSFNSSNKRKRGNSSTAGGMHLTDFPDALIIKTASYLSQTSCISYALAINNNNSHDTTSESSGLPSKLCMAVANASTQSWECIDFMDIQDMLGRRLTDNDVRWVLVAIDAVNKTKSLKLTNCFGILGVGLGPLRGSIVLQWIDLSLVGNHENPTIDPEPPISAADVVPILDSIIGAEGNELVHVQLPKKWRVERSDILTQFLRRFDREMHIKRFVCSMSMCDDICEEELDERNRPAPTPRYDEIPLVGWREDRYVGDLVYGMTSFACYVCKKKFCGGCGLWDFANSFCRCCEKFYCQECCNVNHCQGNNCSGPNQPSSCEECDIVKSW